MEPAFTAFVLKNAFDINKNMQKNNIRSVIAAFIAVERALAANGPTFIFELNLPANGGAPNCAAPRPVKFLVHKNKVSFDPL